MAEIAPFVDRSLVKDLLKENGTPSLASVSDKSWSTASSQSLRDLEDESNVQNESVIPDAINDFKNKSTHDTKNTHIWWGDVEVRVYPIIPGDHPVGYEQRYESKANSFDAMSLIFLFSYSFLGLCSRASSK